MRRLQGLRTIEREIIEKVLDSLPENLLCCMPLKLVITKMQSLQKSEWCSMQVRNLTAWPTVSMTAYTEDRHYSHSCGITDKSENVNRYSTRGHGPDKTFLQVGIKQEDRDAFRFLFKVNGQDEHFRFTPVPFGAEQAHSCRSHLTASVRPTTRGQRNSRSVARQLLCG